MGKWAANFCRNDFLKSKLNEMDFSSCMAPYYNTRDCPYSMKGYLLYDGKKLKSSQGLRWMDSKCQKSIKVPLNLSLFRTEYSTFTKLFGEFSGFHRFQNFLIVFRAESSPRTLQKCIKILIYQKVSYMYL